MENKLLVPSAIIVAGAIIAGAVLYTRVAPAPGARPSSASTQNQQPQVSANAGDVLKIKSGDFVLGDPSAKVVMIEYGDFQCPFCGQFFKTAEQQITEIYVKTGKVAFVWRDFAFLGPESTRASEAARCAGEQGKFWDFHDYLFSHQKGENQGAFSDANLKSFAKILKLDETKFNQCFGSGKYAKAVADSTDEGRAAGVNGTPANFVNGQQISGAVPFSTFQSAIEAELKK